VCSVKPFSEPVPLDEFDSQSGAPRVPPMNHIQAPAQSGWFPDPAGSGNLRFYDGSAWTQSTRIPAESSPAFSTPAAANTMDAVRIAQMFPPAPSRSPELRLPPMYLLKQALRPSRSGVVLLVRSIGTLCFLASIVLLGYSLWETRISAYIAAQAQSELRREFESGFIVPVITEPLSKLPSAVDQPAQVVVTTTTIPPAPPIPLIPSRGQLVGRLIVPNIDIDHMILVGTDRSTLNDGPGLWEASVFPGTPGNAMIAGHRTTYGGPFRHLDALKPGDKIGVVGPSSAACNTSPHLHIDAIAGKGRASCSRESCSADVKAKFIDISKGLFQGYEVLP
jgi:sortase A